MRDDEIISLNGVTENNLKGINIKIRKNEITAITGVSGSGKSSLAFDIIYEYGKSIYLDALSNDGYMMNRSNLVSTKGMLVPIAVAQASISNNNPRSTVGTLLRINQFFRMLYALVGEIKCPYCEASLHTGEVCKCGKYTAAELKSNMFSFNHVNGMCPECGGVGKAFHINIDKVIPDENMTLEELRNSYVKDKALSYTSHLLENGLKSKKIDTQLKYCDLSDEQKQFILYGSEEKIEVIIPATKVQPERKTELVYHGLINALKETYYNSSSEERKKYIEEMYMEIGTCPRCKGNRLNEEALNVRIDGKNIAELLGMSLADIVMFLEKLKSNDVVQRSKNNELQVMIDGLIQKINNIIDVGLDYITFERQISTLSGGEAQRLKLSNYLGIDLTNILYIFDEPSSGLHYKDIHLIATALQKLCDLGNTVIIVEHNRQLIRKCDNLIDIGPMAGIHGGTIVAEGKIEEVMKNENSLTVKYLKQKADIKDLHSKKTFQSFISIKNANVNNLKNISVDIPLHAFVCVTGVSGSGKSTLISDVLYEQLSKEIKLKGECQSVQKVSFISQKPIGRQKRSMIATYTGLFDKIRDLYAKESLSKVLGIKKSDFGVNGGDGRCDKCKGLGVIEQDMLFIPKLSIICDECNGKRYKEKILSVKYNGYSISDILNLTVEESIPVFQENKEIVNVLQVLDEIGLGYLKLGQDTVTLSGGECQRLKLVNEISTKCSNNLYIFDEPSAGLHPYDVDKLMILFQKILKNGASLIVIEHNMDIIQKSDYLVDLGPEGGTRGGEVIAVGSPLEIMKNNKSFTGQALKKIFNI